MSYNWRSSKEIVNQKDHPRCSIVNMDDHLLFGKWMALPLQIVKESVLIGLLG